MKTLITFLSLLSITFANASTHAGDSFVKYQAAEEEIINPFNNDLNVLDINDTIRRDREITESELAIPELSIDQVIAMDIEITEAVLPVYQPLDWNVISSLGRVIKPLRHLNTQH